MAQPKIEIVETVDEQPKVEETSSLKSFTVNHPRTAKVVGFAAVTAATLGAVSWWKARQEAANTEEPVDESNPSDTASPETI